MGSRPAIGLREDGLVTPSNLIQEQLSKACLQALVFNAGYNLTQPVADTYGSDGAIIAPAQLGVQQVDYQLKATTRYEIRGSDLAYDLRVADYNRLIPESEIRRVLLLYTMPADPDQWLAQSEDETCLRHCLYWLSLRGRPASSNAYTERVYVPRANFLDQAGLVNMFRQLTG